MAEAATLNKETIEAVVVSAFSNLGLRPIVEVSSVDYASKQPWFSVVAREKTTHSYSHAFAVSPSEDCSYYQGVITNTDTEHGKVIQSKIIDAHESVASRLGLKTIRVPYSPSARTCNFFPCEPQFWYSRGFTFAGFYLEKQV